MLCVIFGLQFAARSASPRRTAVRVVGVGRQIEVARVDEHQLGLDA